jgi:hypothetical protein
VDNTHEALAAFPSAIVALISGKIKKEAEASHPPIKPANKAANTSPRMSLSVALPVPVDKPEPMEAQELLLCLKLHQRL